MYQIDTYDLTERIRKAETVKDGEAILKEALELQGIEDYKTGYIAGCINTLHSKEKLKMSNLDPSNTEDGNELDKKSREKLRNDIIGCLGIIKQTKYNFEYYSPNSPEEIAEMIINSMHYWYRKQLSNYILKSDVEKMNNGIRVNELNKAMNDYGCKEGVSYNDTPVVKYSDIRKRIKELESSK